MRSRIALLAAWILCSASATAAVADDWLMDRHDASRSGFTPEPIPNRLELRLDLPQSARSPADVARLPKEPRQ